MKPMSVAVALLTILAVASCRPKEQPPEQPAAVAAHPGAPGEPAPQEVLAHVPEQPGPAVAAHTGVVEEVVQATAYTYLRLKEQDHDLWIAVTKRDVNVGEAVSFADGLEMKNFTSKDLQRTFETVYFVSELSGGSQPVASGTSAPMSHQGRPTMEKLELSIERPAGGISIGELFANRQSYAGKTVLVRGQVTKVNRAIMDKNWVHLQDGTGDSGNYDLTITTLEDAKPGEIATFEGTIVLNKDFGSGYAYAVLMENAKKRSE